MTRFQGIHNETCEGRSCLKWENNGELSSTDQRQIVAVMCAMDLSNCPDQSRNDQDA